MSAFVSRFDKTLICSVFSAFFRNGKVIETARGDGIAQVAINFTIERLDEGEWVSTFLQHESHHSTFPGSHISSRICSPRPTSTATRPTEVGHVSMVGRILTGAQADDGQRKNPDGGQITSNYHPCMDKRYMVLSSVNPRGSLAH